MKILRRYLTREIVSSVVLVLLALLMLFSFFDLINELEDVGKGRYGLGSALMFVGLGLPGRLYELFPVGVLIGTMFALAQFVLHSEYTVMRTSGVSVFAMGRTLVTIGLGFALVAFLTGELLAPRSEDAAQRMRLRETSGAVAISAFRSGLWVKDEDSFINVGRILHDTTLQDIRIYEFDPQYRLRTISFAQQGKYARENRWRLEDVVVTRFEQDHTSVSKLAQMEWHSALTPRILSVLLIAPEKMSIGTLFSYVKHLRSNHQESGRYEIALWNKVIYPLTVVVMMFLALPFAYLNIREGGVSTKIFSGIMVGLGFHLVSRLFGHVGALAAWSPPLAATAPTAIFLGLALMLLYRLERR
ncbi:MAG TPA: LPS export ABC transporter permease LptG [Burkholderiales bacterium]|nr:LPS export ABC transporter permease LptG [Burkholderiales bacterium]